MGYVIQYGETDRKITLPEDNKDKKQKHFVWFIGVLSTLLLIVYIWQNEQIADFLLPNNPSVTKHALTVMAENVSSGESLKDAFAAFCREIIDHADLTN